MRVGGFPPGTREENMQKDKTQVNYQWTKLLKPTAYCGTGCGCACPHAGNMWFLYTADVVLLTSPGKSSATSTATCEENAQIK